MNPPAIVALVINELEAKYSALVSKGNAAGAGIAVNLQGPAIRIILELDEK
jgi:hypothetical protein